MVYLIYGENSLVKKEIDDILKKENKYSLIKYDLLENSIAKVIEDINTFNLFGDKKIIIASNLNKLLIEYEDILLKYLDNQNKDNILILTDNTIDERKKIIKELRKKAKIIDASNTSLDDFIKSSFKDYKISNLTISLLKDYCNNNFYRLSNEIDKLKMLKFEEKEIEYDDVKNTVKRSLDKNVFDLTNAINKNDKNKVFEIYYELIKQKEDELKLIAILASNYRTIYKIKILIKENSDTECTKILNMHPYRFKLLKEETYKYSEKQLLTYLKNLSDLDISIKNGTIDKKIGMELFLSKI